MGEEPNIGFMERARGFIRSKAITPSDKVDQYITANLPDLIGEYKLALRRDLDGVDEKIEAFVRDMDDMQDWKSITQERLSEAKERIERIEKNYGMED